MRVSIAEDKKKIADLTFNNKKLSGILKTGTDALKAEQALVKQLQDQLAAKPKVRHLSPCFQCFGLVLVSSVLAIKVLVSRVLVLLVEAPHYTWLFLFTHWLLMKQHSNFGLIILMVALLILCLFGHIFAQSFNHANANCDFFCLKSSTPYFYSDKYNSFHLKS